MNELGRLTEEQLLARFVRDREDAVWDEIVVRNLDRIKAHIAKFEFSAGKRIAEYDRGEVLSYAWERVRKLELKGSSIGELRTAVSQAVWNACMDWGGKRMRYEKRIKGSLDEPAGYDDEGTSRGRFDGEMAEISELRRLLAEEAEEDMELRESQIARLHWAIGRISHDGYREVLEMTYIHKLEAETIASRLGITLDNVYQRRRRGILKLEVILREDRS